MANKDEQFLKKLRATFKVEAEEHLQAMSNGLLQLEKTSGPDSNNIVEIVFRAAHSLKGAARAVDFKEAETLCQSLENVFALWKREYIAPSAADFDAIYKTIDVISSNIAGTGTITTLDLALLEETLAELVESSASTHSTMKMPVAAPVEPPVDKPDLAQKSSLKAEETVRVSVTKLETQLLESEEMLMAKLTASQRSAELRDLATSFEVWRNEWAAIEPEVRNLRLMRNRLPAQKERRSSAGTMRLLDFLDWSVDYFNSVENKTLMLGRKAQQDGHTISKLVDDLLEDSKRLLLLPFSTISAAFPKLVRDICRDQNKEADLVIVGDDTEIDKRILEEMKDPLIHMLRNSIDHGVETVKDRLHKGKSQRATITLHVSQINGNKVQLLLSDDGDGINTEKVKASAIKQGFITQDEADQISETEAHALIFQSSVSTSPIITQLSGRGLGLAIVKEKAEKLGGSVSADSRPGHGTVFRITMPAIRATFRGIVVESAGLTSIIPTTQVERVTRARTDDIQTVEGRETITLEGRTLPLVELADALELEPQSARDSAAGGTPVIVLGNGEQRIAFAVDSVMDELEVLIKPLPRPLSRVRNIAAAAVLGSGRVTPILNVADLLKSARKASMAASRRATLPDAVSRSRRILIAEDSITSRMLLKTILESAGYDVRAAVDGMEAFALLRAEKFDLLVSDVEMPRLNGFDLTARVRADKKLEELPVVLVTALETREDRERGIDVGADAYLVKSNFDQSNLLETVQRLL